MASGVSTLLVGAATGVGCGSDVYPFDPRAPASRPRVLAGTGSPVSDGNFVGGDDPVPTALVVTPPETGLVSNCDAQCRQHCASLGLNNPVNQGLCRSLWGIGLESQPIGSVEACRRLWADTMGRLPTRLEVTSQCEGRPWGDVVDTLLVSDDFVRTMGRRWADRLLYNNDALSITRIFDADILVDKLYRGLMPYDQLVAVISAHPVRTRRHATSGDPAEARFRTFLGRPPFEDERADLGRLYTLWDNAYYDHSALQTRLPDAFIRYRCVDDLGEINPTEAGECTSIKWGFNRLVLTPDARSGTDGRLWSGLLGPDEWEALHLPGRVISQLPILWERAVDDVLEQYLDYGLGTLVPEVRANLVRYLLEANADIRAVHFALLTSTAYLQSVFVDGDDTAGDEEPCRWTRGPNKQIEVEAWIDTVAHATGVDLGRCDPRMPEPNDYMG
ncbi:MAG: hypothetical protein ACI9MR_003661 [Myxococcota bacterium]|jgi:hypothetical protein